jgi:hypothetical protein
MSDSVSHLADVLVSGDGAAVRAQGSSAFIVWTEKGKKRETHVEGKTSSQLS